MLTATLIVSILALAVITWFMIQYYMDREELGVTKQDD